MFNPTCYFIVPSVVIYRHWQCWLWESQRALRWKAWAGHTPTSPSASHWSSCV